MAPLWLALVMLLSGFVTAGSYKLPSLWFLVEDGSTGEDAHRLPAIADSLASAQRQWEWKASGDKGHKFPLLHRGKREDGLVLKNLSIPVKEQPKKSLPVPETTAGTSTALKKIFKGETADPSSHITAAPEKVSREVGTVTTAVGLSLNTPKSRDSLKLANVSAEIKEGHHFVTDVMVTSRGASETVHARKETVTVAFPETGRSLTTTEHWTRQHDESTATMQTLGAGTDVSTAVPKRGLATSGPVMKSKQKHVSSLKTTKDSPTTATLQPWLDDISTASSQTLVDISDASTATESQDLDTVKPKLRAKGKGSFILETDIVSSTTATTTPLKPLGDSTTVVGKCLLALLLLALVAAVFIVITAVLATMLWRQKQAYKMRQYNHTEMVCISSLLATEEAEEGRGRTPQVKRVKMLRENGSETEMDNLTLNSFLPEH